MDGTFTLPYSEFAVANRLNSVFKRHNLAVYIPTSRQQKGVDLILHKNGTHNIARVQVKSSRTYYGDKNREYPYYLWLNNFVDRYEKGLADFYIIYGMYSVPNEKKRITTKHKIWKEIFICYNDKEMSTLLNSIKTKTGKKDAFFGFGFCSSKEVYLDRGFSAVKNKEASNNLLDNKTTEIIKFLS